MSKHIKYLFSYNVIISVQIWLSFSLKFPPLSIPKAITALHCLYHSMNKKPFLFQVLTSGSVINKINKRRRDPIEPIPHFRFLETYGMWFIIVSLQHPDKSLSIRLTIFSVHASRLSWEIEIGSCKGTWTFPEPNHLNTMSYTDT